MKPSASQNQVKRQACRKWHLTMLSFVVILIGQFSTHLPERVNQSQLDLSTKNHHEAEGGLHSNSIQFKRGMKNDDSNRAIINLSKSPDQTPSKAKNHQKSFFPSDRYNIESRNTTVMGMALGLRLYDLQIFVGSLRWWGYSGTIILGVKEDVDDETMDFFRLHNVVVKIIRYANCSFEPFLTQEAEIKDLSEEDKAISRTCGEAYPDVKMRWLKYPIGRDWLASCVRCTGPVLLTDVRDVFFQNDPFGPGTYPIEGLQVFQEHVNMTTENWLTDWPIGDCKGVHFNKPMLCSGSIIGTYHAMMEYLDKMYAEMKAWIVDPKCRFLTEADDQSIHNWLYYNGDLGNHTVAVPNRMGIVNTVGYESGEVFKIFVAGYQKTHNVSFNQAFDQMRIPETSKTWLSPDFGLTDDNGFFLNLDGSISRVVHQWDRSGPLLNQWLQMQDFIHPRRDQVTDNIDSE